MYWLSKLIILMSDDQIQQKIDDYDKQQQNQDMVYGLFLLVISLVVLTIGVLFLFKPEQMMKRSHKQFYTGNLEVNETGRESGIIRGIIMSIVGVIALITSLSLLF